MTDVILGVRDSWGKEVPFGLAPADRRQHLYVVGKSGTGKTTLLRNLILQDIEAGRGVGVLDPHGDLARDVLEHVPRSRAEDVAYFDPSDAEYPMGLNLLASVPKDKRPLVASGVVSVFKTVWPEFFGPRMEHLLNATVLALLDCENVTLLGLQRMLTDARYRAWVVRQVKDPAVKAFWEREFESYDKRLRAEMVSPILNKVGQFLMSPIVRNVLGQVRNRMDARFMMDHGRIFVANLSKGSIGGDKASLIGALLVTQFQLAAMSRADVRESERLDFYLYVDELQSFVTDSFAAILSEARKYRLCLTLSHQYREQLKPEIAAAITGNVGSVVAFRVGHEDAQALENAFGSSFTAPHFTSLSNREVYAKLLTNGEDSEPFHGRTLPPCGQRHNRHDKIVQRSRERYARRRAEVERRIARWIT